jgi:hypothetical protein
MQAQTILFLVVDRVSGKLNCRIYRGGGEGNPKSRLQSSLFQPIRFFDHTTLRAQQRVIQTDRSLSRLLREDWPKTAENWSL